MKSEYYLLSSSEPGNEGTLFGSEYLARIVTLSRRDLEDFLMTAVDITGQLAGYMAQARDMRLAPYVAQEAKHRILDALAAMVSGSHLPAGEMAIQFARAQGGVAEATVLATDVRTSAVNAALANGMFAHADETDDFEPVTKAHPGSHVVPAALAMAEREGGSGAELLAAVTLGYDI